MVGQTRFAHLKKASVLTWAPAALMAVAAVFTVGVDVQRAMSLRQPLAAALPIEIEGYVGEDVRLSEGEVQVAGVTDYVMRVYRRGDSGQHDWFSVYAGYYDQQSQGKTIHSPKNCLPGSGWEALASQTAKIEAGGATYTVNRYLLQRDEEQALVLYWYQGRGRVEANEYVVKWDLLRDAALRGRSDEALVRISVPVSESEERALELAIEVARWVLPAVAAALPA